MSRLLTFLLCFVFYAFTKCFDSGLALVCRAPFSGYLGRAFKQASLGDRQSWFGSVAVHNVTQSPSFLSVLFSSCVNWECEVLPLGVAVEAKSLQSVCRSIDGDGQGSPQTDTGVLGSCGLTYSCTGQGRTAYQWVRLRQGSDIIPGHSGPLLPLASLTGDLRPRLGSYFPCPPSITKLYLAELTSGRTLAEQGLGWTDRSHSRSP